MTDNAPPVHCDLCGKAITDPDDFMVLSTLRLRPHAYCRVCFAEQCKRTRAWREGMGKLINHMTDGELALQILFMGVWTGIIIFMLTQVGPILWVRWILIGMLVVGVSAFGLKLYHRWYSFTKYELPLMHYAGRRQ